ncbi:hypothetical protein HDV00_008798 [Rhizophlyctis rosea]|nr:hypothetical protein HDV00_008798 [Rhizophlyctis rosea]
MSLSEPPTITLTIAYKSSTHKVTLPRTANLSDLKEALSSDASISIPPASQKFFIGGKSSYPDSTLLADLPITKIVLIHSSGNNDWGIKRSVEATTSVERTAKTQEVTTSVERTAKTQEVKADRGIKRSVETTKNVERTAKTQEVKAEVRKKSTVSSAYQSATRNQRKPLAFLHHEYLHTFHNFTPLPNFPDTPEALTLLKRLASDPAIQQIMRKHRWSVQHLIEIHPHGEHSGILGYNRGNGQLIALRLRTDTLWGFRSFDSIRRVLLHELTHNVYSGHGWKFHALNRELNEECDLVHMGETTWDEAGYLMSEEVMVDEKAFEGGVFVLGGE